MRDALTPQPARLGTRRALGRVRAGAWRPRLAARWANPWRLVLLLAFVQIALWGVLSAHLIAAPQNDSLEQVLLSQEFQLAYGKHPPLPTWLLYGVNQLFGASIGATHLLGALCSVATLLLLYTWARPLIGASRAALATLLASGVEFMSSGTTYFNHNTVQLPFALLTIVLFHRALTRTRRVDWALLGAAAGLMLLVKFSAVVLFAAFALYLVWTRRLREPRTLRGLALAALVCAAVVAPHFIAALDAPTASGGYAAQSLYPDHLDRIQRLKSVWNFAISHAAKVAPALLIFIWLRRRAPPAAQRSEQADALRPFLTIVGFAPLLLTLGIATLAGAFLLVGWGTTFHVLLTFWLVAASPWAVQAPRRVLLRAALACIALQVTTWSVLTANGGAFPNLNRMKPYLTALPPPELAQAVQDAWAEHSGSKLHHVISDVRTGAALAVAFGGVPRVVDGRRGDFEAVLPSAVAHACGSVTVASSAPVADPQSRHYAAWDARFAAPTVLSVVEFHHAGPGKFYIGVRAPAPGAICPTGL